MAVHNTGAAYDLSRYEVPQPAQKPPVQEVPARRKKRVQRVRLRIQTICTFSIVVLLIGWMVLNQVWLTEVSGDIYNLNKQIQEMESENARMMSELEATVSLRSIGETAKTELGMNHRTPQQTVYITLEQEDRIELNDNLSEQTLGGRVKLTFTEWIGSIQEYIDSE